MKEGATLVLFDGEGNEYIARLGRFRKDGSSEAQLVERLGSDQDAGVKLSVAQAIPQDRKFDLIIQKAAELGLFELIPLETERTIVRIPKDQYEKVHARWNRIAEQTMKQSRVSRKPNIFLPTSFSQLMEKSETYNRMFLLHPSPDAKPIHEIQPSDMGERSLLLIGPEGGFSSRECVAAKARGATVLGLGSGILKTDTAFVAVASFFKFTSGRECS